MKFLNSKFVKKHILFFILIPLVFISQIYLLKPHLQYGFEDTADQYITSFRELREKYPNPIQFLIQSTQELELFWVHEYYYVGILNYLYGDNLVAYHQTTHFLKSLATLSTYPLFFILTGSSLVAFISALMFAISYASAGSLEDLVVGGDYIGIMNLSIFLTIYFYLVKKGSDSSILTYLTGLIFLVSTLSIATTRSFPIVFIIVATEIFMIFKNRSAKNLKLIIKRLAIFILPILLVIVISSGDISQRINDVSTGLNQFIFSSGDTKAPLNSNYPGGEHELLLIPLGSFASTILPMAQLPSKTFILFLFLTIIIGFLLSKKPLRFIFVVILVWIIGNLVISWSWSTSSTHNFQDLSTKSIVGFYVLGLALSFFIEWLKTKNSLYIGLFLGPILSFMFVFITWLITQERLLLFLNIHRYLTISSVFISFFLGSFIVVFYKRLKSSRWLKLAAYFPFLLIPIFLIISSGEINKFFNDRFAYGFDFQDMDLMRRQLLPYLSDIKKSRLIYIDIYSDKKNSYYYGQIYHEGPLFWLTQYNKHINSSIIPYSIFNYEYLKSYVATRDGITGILYQGGNFYKPEDFRAVGVMDKKVIDITDQVKKELKLF